MITSRVMTSKDWLKVVIVPLFIAIITPALTILYQKLFVEGPKGKEVSFSIAGPVPINIQREVQVGEPTVITKPQEGKSPKIYYPDTEPASSEKLYNYLVEVSITGDEPMRDLPILYRFSPASKDFKIISTHHVVNDYEFGKIREVDSSNMYVRYVYELLNPKETFKVSFTTNEEARLAPYSKMEGFRFKELKQGMTYSPLTLVKISLLSLVVSILTLILFWVVLRIRFR